MDNYLLKNLSRLLLAYLQPTISRADEGSGWQLLLMKVMFRCFCQWHFFLEVFCYCISSSPGCVGFDFAGSDTTITFKVLWSSSLCNFIDMMWSSLCNTWSEFSSIRKVGTCTWLGTHLTLTVLFIVNSA